MIREIDCYETQISQMQEIIQEARKFIQSVHDLSMGLMRFKAKELLTKMEAVESP